MKMYKGKKRRSLNFLEEEKIQLLHIIKRFLPIVENKKTDAVSSNVKTKTWELIADEFNSYAETGERTGPQLRALFDSLKKYARKHEADDKAKVIKNEDGVVTPQLPSLSAVDKEVLLLIKSNVQPNDPLDCNPDYDSAWSNNSVEMDSIQQADNSSSGTINDYKTDPTDEGTSTTSKSFDEYHEVSKGKRERSRNFIEDEKVLLFNIVKRFLAIVENRRTDSASNNEKHKTWERITDEYNSSEQMKTGERSIGQLKCLFDQIKKQAKKYKMDEMTEAYKTGICTKTPSSMTALYDEVLQLIGSGLHPLQNPLDSNANDDSGWGVSDNLMEVDSTSRPTRPAEDTMADEPGSSIFQLDAGRPPWASKKRKEVDKLDYREELHKKRMDILSIMEEREKIDLQTAKVRFRMSEEREAIELEKAKVELEIKKIELEKMTNSNAL